MNRFTNRLKGKLWAYAMNNPPIADTLIKSDFAIWFITPR